MQKNSRKRKIIHFFSLERTFRPLWLRTFEFQMLTFIYLFLVSSVASLDLIGRTQWAAVKGKLNCEGKPASGVKVKLMESDSKGSLGIQILILITDFQTASFRGSWTRTTRWLRQRPTLMESSIWAGRPRKSQLLSRIWQFSTIVKMALR